MSTENQHIWINKCKRTFLSTNQYVTVSNIFILIVINTRQFEKCFQCQPSMVFAVGLSSVTSVIRRSHWRRFSPNRWSLCTSKKKECSFVFILSSKSVALHNEKKQWPLQWNLMKFMKKFVVYWWVEGQFALSVGWIILIE